MGQIFTLYSLNLQVNNESMEKYKKLDNFLFFLRKTIVFFFYSSKIEMEKLFLDKDSLRLYKRVVNYIHGYNCIFSCIYTGTFLSIDMFFDKCLEGTKCWRFF